MGPDHTAGACALEDCGQQHVREKASEGGCGVGIHRSESYGLTFPVLGEGDIMDNALTGLYGAGIFENAIPFMILLDKDMSIDEAYKVLRHLEDPPDHRPERRARRPRQDQVSQVLKCERLVLIKPLDAAIVDESDPTVRIEQVVARVRIPIEHAGSFPANVSQLAVGPWASVCARMSTGTVECIDGDSGCLQ